MQIASNPMQIRICGIALQREWRTIFRDLIVFPLRKKKILRSTLVWLLVLSREIRDFVEFVLECVSLSIIRSHLQQSTFNLYHLIEVLIICKEPVCGLKRVMGGGLVYWMHKVLVIKTKEKLKLILPVTVEPLNYQCTWRSFFFSHMVF